MRMSIIVVGMALSQASQASGAKMPNWTKSLLGEKSAVPMMVDGKPTSELQALIDENGKPSANQAFLVSTPKEDAYSYKTKSDLKKIGKKVAEQACKKLGRSLNSFEVASVDVNKDDAVYSWDETQKKFVSKEYQAEGDQFYYKRDFPHGNHRRWATFGLAGLGASAAVGTAGAATVGAGVTTAINAASIPAMAIGGVGVVAGTVLLGTGIGAGAIVGTYYFGLGFKALYDLYQSRRLGYFAGTKAFSSHNELVKRSVATGNKVSLHKEPLVKALVKADDVKSVKAVSLKGLSCGDQDSPSSIASRSEGNGSTSSRISFNLDQSPHTTIAQ